jgi:alanine racemase
MVRIGLFINGICPSPAVRLVFDLKPSLSLSSRLIQVKSVPAHSKISYNGLYETTKETIIGTIPIGYADGYDRRIKDGRVWVDGMYAKIVGRVCMDLIMVELPRWVEEGTLVELIGPHVTLYEYSSWINTNTYHATCAFSDRIPRIYHRFQSVIAVVNRRIEHQF